MIVQNCACVLLLMLCIINLGNSLECFECNITVSAVQNDACKGLGSVKKCQDPAVCLSVVYYEESPQKIRQYTTFKTCSGVYGGKECEVFLKNARTLNPAAKVDYVENSEKCFTCSEKECNRSPPKESSTSCNKSSYVVFVSLLCYLSKELFY